MNRRWRPSLSLVLGGGLATTLALSFAGLVALRYLGPAIGFRNAALLLALSITAATALLGWLMVRLLLRPILALEHYAKAQEVAADPMPPEHFGTRELYITARRVIDMAETLRDREMTIRVYTDYVTHELKTPASAIRAAVELLEDGGTLSDEDRRLIGDIDGARLQIEAQLAALRRVAQAREPRYLGHATLTEVAPALALDCPDLLVTLEGAHVFLPISAEGLAIVLGQLLRNAAQSGAHRITLHATEANAAPRLHVADDGHGISAGNAARIFDPFFTTRRDSGGTGIGLTVVRNILQAHRAEIDLLPAPTGTAFRISFKANSV